MFNITGFSVIKTIDGYILSYTLNEKDTEGRILRSNIHKSCQIPESIMTNVNAIEDFIKTDI